MIFCLYLCEGDTHRSIFYYNKIPVNIVDRIPPPYIELRFQIAHDITKHTGK